MSIICIGLSSISTIVFTKDYVSDIKNYCQKYTLNGTLFNSTESLYNTSVEEGGYSLSNLIDDCKKYMDYGNTNVTNDDEAFEEDWLSDMSTYNLRTYYDIFKYKATKKQIDNIDNILLDYSFMYFLTGICVLITNFLFIKVKVQIFQ